MPPKISVGKPKLGIPNMKKKQSARAALGAPIEVDPCATANRENEKEEEDAKNAPEWVR